jgi:glycosyltransferase involved in cell wall biosynthesis
MAVPPMDPVGLAVAVVGLVRAPDKRVALGLAGRKLVAERYDVRNVAAQYEAIYDEVLAAHQASKAVTRKGFRIPGSSPWP